MGVCARGSTFAAISASGQTSGINEPQPGQGLRLKPIQVKRLQKTPHYFRQNPPTAVMDIWGSPLAVGRGLLAVFSIGIASYHANSFLVAPAGFALLYVLAFHAFSFHGFKPARSSSSAMSRTSQRVCIVGGGLSGIVTLKELRAAGHQPQVFEGSGHIGGAFNGAYSSCHLSVSNHWMAFSDFPAEEDGRLFWTAAQYLSYLSQYVAHFNLADGFTYRTKVTNVEKRPDSRAPLGVTYLVTLQQVDTGELRTQVFDAVVVCTGTNAVAKVPEFEGRCEFEAAGGVVVHSSEYSDAGPFKDKHVVCIGAGESGADIVKEVSDVAASCYLSLRRGVSVATKYPMRSQHTNDAFHAKLHYYAHPTLNNWLFADLNKKIIALEAIDPVFAMIGRINQEAGGGSFQFITKNETFVESLCNGTCTKKGAISRLSATGVDFADGTSVSANVVICNTGFRRNQTCLEQMGLTVAATRDLFQHMICPDTGPSLAFIGWARPAEGGVPAVSEMQARYLAQLLSGDRALPEDCLERTLADKAADEARYFLSPNLESQVHYPRLMKQLAELVGCEPNMAMLFFTDHALWHRLWFGSQQACTYRLCGPGSTRSLALNTINRLPIAWFANSLSSRVAVKLFAMNLVTFACSPFGVFEASW